MSNTPFTLVPDHTTRASQQLRAPGPQVFLATEGARLAVFSESERNNPARAPIFLLTQEETRELSEILRENGRWVFSRFDDEQGVYTHFTGFCRNGWVRLGFELMGIGRNIICSHPRSQVGLYAQDALQAALDLAQQEELVCC